MNTAAQQQPRAAFYARYSSDVQSPLSIEDQFRLCRRQAESLGYDGACTYSDGKTSGTHRIHLSGLQELLEDAAKGKFEAVICEGLDRISRDQEDTCHFYKRMLFHGVKLITLTDGTINELHVGLKGTMNALFLKDLAFKTLRGMIGRVEAGYLVGGSAYGYRKVCAYDAGGDRIKGLREIDPERAKVVARVFTRFADGLGTKHIATLLNEDGVAAARGGKWTSRSLDNMLTNEHYTGTIIYNRSHYLKDPDTGRRVRRENPREQWIVKQRAEFRIIEQALWDRAQKRMGEHARPGRKVRVKDVAPRPDPEPNTASGTAADKPGGIRPVLSAHRRPLTGVVTCGDCGGEVAMTAADRYGCADHDVQCCHNTRHMKARTVERQVIRQLKNYITGGSWLPADAPEDHAQVLGAEAARQIRAIERQLKEIAGQRRRLVAAIAHGIAPQTVRGNLQKLENRQAILHRQMLDIRPVPDHRPASKQALKATVLAALQRLESCLADPRMSAYMAQKFRSLVERVAVSSQGGAGRGCTVEVTPSIAGLLNIAGWQPPSPVPAG